ncbi:hypothetical protein BJX68DRAFT_271938 [Aspergillus pseudodeflectus]|uniref:ER transporter 6TM N-terminal domain-containing protein n=1 Tax=Aspergillus pseudodeflectus TaxID=176178 RepID=A0ABR4JIL5_9EURO
MTGSQGDTSTLGRPGAAKAAEVSLLTGLFSHFNGHDLKIFFRCFVGAWVGSLLMFINPSLHELGTATFFACLVQLIIPPNGIVFIHILGVLSVLLGVFLAYAWGVIAMKAALAARPGAETAARLQLLQQTAVMQANQTGITPADAAQRLIYDGFMLDARVTVVMYCFACVFIYFLARLRASNPKTVFAHLFGSIIIDIFLVYTPLIPSFDGSLPLPIVKPTLVGVGLSLVSSIIFFPRSTSHTVLDSMRDMVRLVKVPLEVTEESLAKDKERVDRASLHQTRAGIIALVRQVEPAIGFLPIDFSLGYCDPRDVKSLVVPMQKLVASAIMLLDFNINQVHRETRTEELIKFQQQLMEKDDSNLEMTETSNGPAHHVGHHQLVQLVKILDGFPHPNPDGYPDDQALAKEFSVSSTAAINSCLKTQDHIAECMHKLNHGGWLSRIPEPERQELIKRTEASLDTLRASRTVFIDQTTELLLREYQPVFESHDAQSSQLPAMHDLHGLVLGMALQEQLSTVFNDTEVLLSQVGLILQKSTSIRLWLPSSLRYALAWIAGKKGDAPATDQVNDTDPDKPEEPRKAISAGQHVITKSQTPRRSGLAHAVLNLYHWLTGSDGLFALRMVVVSIALSIPAVIPRTAGFYYREKGLWALIMGQTGLLVYMADFTFSVISRLLGTLIGGVLALLAWYVGSANGPGNPYGLGAVMAVMVAILMWVRIWCPFHLLQASIMAAATFLLIIGFSYDDQHLPQYGSAGLGYVVFWKRLVLVLVGVAAALVVQMFPSPPSAAGHVSRTLSTSLRTVSDHYAVLLSCWNNPETNTQALTEPLTLGLAYSLLDLEGLIKQLAFEFSSSPFTSSNTDQIKDLCLTLNREVGRLLSLSSSLPLEYRIRLTQQCGMFDHRHIGEVMAVLAVCEQALKTGDPLPEILPTPVVRRAFEYRGAANGPVLEFTAAAVRDENYRRFCVALSAYFKFLWTVDELVIVVKGAVGESHLVSKEVMGVV